MKAAAALGQIANVRPRGVGFDISREDWPQQLTDRAKAAGGQYPSASRGERLQRELRSAVFGIPESCEVLDAMGQSIKRLCFGDTLPLEPGESGFVTTFAGQRYDESFYVSPGETTAITFAAAAAEAATAAKSAAADAAKPPELMRPTGETPSPGSPAAKPPAAASKFCSNCGLPLKAGSTFCTRCGQKIGP